MNRGKKKSALSKLKNRHKGGSDGSSQSLNCESDDSDNFRGSRQPRYPIDADVQIDSNGSDHSSSNGYQGGYSQLTSSDKRKYQLSYPTAVDSTEDSGTDDYRKPLRHHPSIGTTDADEGIEDSDQSDSAYNNHYSVGISKSSDRPYSDLRSSSDDDRTKKYSAVDKDSRLTNKLSDYKKDDSSLYSHQSKSYSGDEGRHSSRSHDKHTNPYSLEMKSSFNDKSSTDMLDEYKQQLTHRSKLEDNARVRRSLSDSDLDLEEEAQNGVSPLVTRTTYASKTPKPTAMESLDFYNSRNADDHQSLGTRSLSSSTLSRDRPWLASLARAASPSECMSQRSIQSLSALPMIATRDARERSYLVGSISSRASLLGQEELLRFFPEQQMKIFVGTWNMMEMKDIPESLDDFVLPDSQDYIADMYVIGTQESCANRRQWEVRLQETLGPQHVLFHSGVFGCLYLLIFIRRDLVWFCSIPEEDSISTRAGPTGVKTKGAVAVSFTFFGTSLLFICSHFAPHDGNMMERVANFNKISTSLQLPKEVVTNPYVLQQEDVTSRFDCVFWMGDLNFRLEKEREKVDWLVKGAMGNNSPKYETLLAHDELTRVRNEDLAFQDFQEGRITFCPSYKFDIGTDNYDTSKKMRIPSYTDRVLYRCKKKNSVSCLHYNSPGSVRASDHRPVYGIFDVNLRPGRDNIPLAAGIFNREVWLEANKRRGDHLNETSIQSDKNSSTCNIQ